ncbi:unnamed protein product [Aureobasidium pullulans]|nr:unnamed protein product [Aureobasidium pullulans]
MSDELTLPPRRSSSSTAGATASQTHRQLEQSYCFTTGKDELVERNILPDSTAAPALQNHQRELAAAMRRDSIEKHLQTRPSPAELIKEGILEG